MRTSSALLTSTIDCESVKDFYQYYRERYFGIVIAEGGPTWPCILSQRVGASPGHVVYDYYNPETNAWITQDMTWTQFEDAKCFRFGYPNLGTVPFGPSYCYVANSPRRESLKGIGLYKAIFSVPQHDFIMGRYIAKEPRLRKMLGAAGYYGTSDEATLLIDILNKKYFDWDEAIQGLENGDRIGYQLNKHSGIYLDDKDEDLLISYKEITRFARVKPYLDSFRVELIGSYKHLIPLAMESLAPLKPDLIIA